MDMKEIIAKVNAIGVDSIKKELLFHATESFMCKLKLIAIRGDKKATFAERVYKDLAGSEFTIEEVKAAIIKRAKIDGIKYKKIAGHTCTYIPNFTEEFSW